jgi:antitoxin (DNA-binding transcriptional repressor) of toxin-antitoxin stability system
MRTATVADLRNHFPKVVAWLDQGEDVEILRRGKPVACLVPPRLARPATVVKIDFAKRNKEIWGDRVFSMQEVEEMRAFELEGEEG